MVVELFNPTASDMYFPLSWLRNICSSCLVLFAQGALALSQPHGSYQMSLSIETIRLRTKANGIWASQGYPAVTVCGQVTTGGHGFSMEMRWVDAAPKGR